ncbi:hypothetical protein [Polyangium jinanense]|uniref:Uncharacterized protein n=1 Tax=Polyangium jinanense TaxID=2829994 RepID=A0A9X3XBE5_9BACT|nr:hypothetical protein [Polyangium jinanense]MDC3956995.1 hypothetical protein [Polyangium jinanense]MDC3987152.1 hypothetical protein [Polyangium jinanense]
MTEARSTAPQRGDSAGAEFVRAMFNLITGALSIGVAVMCLVNVFGSTIEVDRLASHTACEGQSATCQTQYTMWERTPWAHTLQLSTPAGTKSVQCQREHILVGAWHCTELGKAVTTTPSASAAPAVAFSTTAPRSVAPKGRPPEPSPSPPAPSEGDR